MKPSTKVAFQEQENITKQQADSCTDNFKEAIDASQASEHKKKMYYCDLTGTPIYL